MDHLKRLAELTLQEKQIKKEITELKNYCLEGYLNNENFELENETVKLSIIPQSSSISIDLKKVQEKESQLYKELIEVYPKETIRKAHVKVNLR